MKASILIVDDNKSRLSALEILLSPEFAFVNCIKPNFIPFDMTFSNIISLFQ